MQKSRILEIVDAYFLQHPREKDRLGDFIRFLTTNDDLFGRKNFNGHITTSAIVFDPTNTRILLIVHKALGRHLQPGGHFEKDPTLAASAAREVLEETGITVTPHPLAKGDLPFDIDAHWMPENPAKQEDGHWHFDFRYLFTTPHSEIFQLQVEEITSCAWHDVGSDIVRDCFHPLPCWDKLVQNMIHLPGHGSSPAST